MPSPFSYREARVKSGTDCTCLSCSTCQQTLPSEHEVVEEVMVAQPEGTITAGYVQRMYLTQALLVADDIRD